MKLKIKDMIYGDNKSIKTDKANCPNCQKELFIGSIDYYGKDKNGKKEYYSDTSCDCSDNEMVTVFFEEVEQ